ncbi:MAG: hypothetical protein ABW158_22630 [Candidatus Thiodiazotropha sp. 6PDIVS]
MTNSIVNNNASVSLRSLSNSTDSESLNADNSHTDTSISQSEKTNHQLCKSKSPNDLWSNFSTVSDKISNLQTESEILRTAPTTADSLINSPTSAEMLSGKNWYTDSKENECTLSDFNFEKNIDCDVSIYANDSKSFHLGRFQLQYTKPNFDASSEKMKAGGGAGLSTGITLTHANPELKIGEIGKVDARFRVGVANAGAKAEGQVQFDLLNPKNSGASIKSDLGAEALLGDARYSMDLIITPKTVGDTVAGIYNDYVDPVVDYVVGSDVPEIPSVPEEYDHGVAVSGHATTGFGGAAKIGGELEIGNGKGVKFGVKAKLGIGPVLGAGFTVGAK